MAKLEGGEGLGGEAVEALRTALPAAVLGSWDIPVAETVIAVQPSDLVQAVDVLLSSLGMWHLSTITADIGPSRAGDAEVLRLLYHFWHGAAVTLAVELPLTAASIATLTVRQNGEALIPGAAFYEREIFGMFGVRFDGHSDLRPLLLPDDWEGDPPMGRGIGVSAGVGGDT